MCQDCFGACWEVWEISSEKARATRRQQLFTKSGLSQQFTVLIAKSNILWKKKGRTEYQGTPIEKGVKMLSGTQSFGGELGLASRFQKKN